MASGIAPGHVRLTAATESRKTAAIFQIIGSLRIDDFGTTAPLGHLLVPRRRPVEI